MRYYINGHADKKGLICNPFIHQKAVTVEERLEEKTVVVQPEWSGP
jgi:hypothetical protein